ncbi:hypothetical protein G9A89_023008 [Geosiphon pyriformis]|nr:hypothetical protein G9A89_023008 [Geosiphon pyriformis]
MTLLKMNEGLPTETMIQIFSEVAEQTRRVWRFRCLSKDMKIIIEAVIADNFRQNIEWRVTGWTYDEDSTWSWEIVPFKPHVILASSRDEQVFRILPIVCSKEINWSLMLPWYEFWLRAKKRDHFKWRDLSERIEKRRMVAHGEENWFGDVCVVHSYHEAGKKLIKEFKIELGHLFSLFEGA